MERNSSHKKMGRKMGRKWLSPPARAKSVERSVTHVGRPTYTYVPTLSRCNASSLNAPSVRKGGARVGTSLIGQNQNQKGRNWTEPESEWPVTLLLRPGHAGKSNLIKGASLSVFIQVMAYVSIRFGPLTPTDTLP